LSEAVDIERDLSSVGRLRILRYLARNPRGEASLSEYRLRVLTGLRLPDIGKHLELLVGHGWVMEVEAGTQKRYRLNVDAPYVKSLRGLFEAADYV
jgi:DNA-binding transcriptional ArsR family regulator